MAVDVKIPEIGESITEGFLAEWSQEGRRGGRGGGSPPRARDRQDHHERHRRGGRQARDPRRRRRNRRGRAGRGANRPERGWRFAAAGADESRRTAGGSGADRGRRAGRGGDRRGRCRRSWIRLSPAVRRLVEEHALDPPPSKAPARTAGFSRVMSWPSSRTRRRSAERPPIAAAPPEKSTAQRRPPRFRSRRRRFRPATEPKTHVTAPPTPGRAAGRGAADHRHAHHLQRGRHESDHGAPVANTRRASCNNTASSSVSCRSLSKPSSTPSRPSPRSTPSSRTTRSSPTTTTTSGSR